MTEQIELNGVFSKLATLLKSYGYKVDFEGSSYPVTFTVYPDLEAQGQTTMFDGEDEETLRDARLCLIFQDAGVLVETASTLRMPEELLNKVKSLCKKAHYLFLQMYFRSRMTEPTDDAPSESYAPEALPEAE